MKLIIVIGTNIGDRLNNLNNARTLINSIFKITHTSRVYKSDAVDYLNQDYFYNQALECEIPQTSPTKAMNTLLEIEIKMGRKRDISKGPRLIDIDIIFWGTMEIKEQNLTTPHPAWFQRSFVCLPILELPYSDTLRKNFIFPESFTNSATPID